MSVPAPRVKNSPPSVPAVVSPNPVAWRATAPGTSILAGMSLRLMCIVPSVVVSCDDCRCRLLQRACRSLGREPGSFRSGRTIGSAQPAARAELRVQHVFAPEDLAGHHCRVGQCDLKCGLG